MKWVLLVLTGQFTLVSASAAVDRSGERYCQMTPAENVSGPTTYTLENGQEIQRTFRINGPVHTYEIRGHQHLGTMSGDLATLVADTSASDEEFLQTLQRAVEPGQNIERYRLPDLRDLRSQRGGVLFLEENAAMFSRRRQGFRDAYKILQKNMTDRGLLPENQELFDRFSAIVFGESFTRSFETGQFRLRPIGNRELMQASQDSLQVQLQALRNLEALVPSGEVTQEQVNRIRRAYSLLIETSLTHPQGEPTYNYQADLEGLSQTARNFALQGFRAAEQHARSLAPRDRSLAEQMINARGGSNRVFHVGAYHVQRVASHVQQLCMDKLQEMNQRMLRNVDRDQLPQIQHLLYRGPRGGIAYPEGFFGDDGGDSGGSTPDNSEQLY